MDDLKNKTVRGAFWALVERLGTQVVSFVVGMILARLLTPNDYGTVALLSIFLAVATVLMDGGFSSALIQKKNATELDFNSVFYLCLGLSVILYAVLFAAAPYIAAFYNTPVLKDILRISALCLIFGAVNSIQNAELSRKMLFHLSFRISVITTIASSIVGVTLAFLGYGPWALVWSSLSSGFVSVIARWIIIAWRPRLMFSFRSLRSLFNFGWKMTAIFAIDSIVKNIYGVLIGKLYSKSDLAYFNKGKSVPDLVMGTVEGTIGRVTFPALMQLQDDKSRLRNAMRRMITTSTFFVFPMMVGLGVCAPSIIRLLYGNQWDIAIPYMQVFCFCSALMPLHNVNLTAITAIGRSGLFLKLELIKKALSLLLLIVVFKFGVYAFALTLAFVSSPLCIIINTWPNRKLFGYSLEMQVIDVLPVAISSILMGMVVWGIGILLPECGVMNLVVKVALQIIVGVISYFVLMWVARCQVVAYVLPLIAKPIKKINSRLYDALESHFNCA